MDHNNNANNKSDVSSNASAGATTSQPLFLIGNIGADHIVRTLSQASNPFQAIENFQKENSLGKENASIALPALSLLDLHNVPRAEVYLRILERLKLNLLKQIEQTHDEKNLEALLEQTFPYISFEELRAIPFAIMKQIPEVPARFLRKLIDTELYRLCPLEVKRQMWLMDETLFRTKVVTLLNEFIAGEGSGASLQYSDFLEIIAPDATLSPAKRRESSQIIQELIQLVGKSVALYNMVLHFFRTLFVANKKPALCNLRADFLMALHDAGVSEIYELDPCHKFAWTLDACVRDSIVEIRRIRELQTFFSTVSSSDPIIGDLSMITANPYTCHMLVRNAFSTLVTVVQKEAIPKDDETLNYVTWLLNIALQTHSMIQNQNFSLPKQTKEISQSLYPLLAFKILDDQSRKQNQPPEELDPELELMFRSNNIARKIILYYILTRVVQRDILAVEQLVPFISGMNDISDDLDFFQSLVTQLIISKDLRMAALVIDSILLPIRNSQKEYSTFIHRNLVRFLVESHLRLPTRDLVNYINKFVSLGSYDEKVASGYRVLLEKASQRLNNKNVPILFNYLYDSVVESSESSSSSKNSSTQSLTHPRTPPSEDDDEEDPMSDEE